MKKSFQKTLMLCILTVLSLICITLGACQLPLTLTLVNPVYTYYTGSTVDLYDFVEREAGVTYTFSVSHISQETGEATEWEEVIGRTYCATEASVYTLTVTATKNGKTATQVTTFNVYDKKAVVFIPKGAPQVYEVGTKYRSRVLLAKLSALILSDTDYEFWLDSVTYQANMPASLKPVENTNPKVTTQLEKDVDGGLLFTFENAGSYEFTMCVENKGGVVRKTFQANALDNQQAPQGVDAAYHAEFGMDEANEYNSVVKLYGTTENRAASYVAINGGYTAGQVIRLEFYGQNMPSRIGLFGQVEEGSLVPYSLTEGEGYVFSMEETNSYEFCLHGPTRLSPTSKFLKRPTKGNPDHDIERFSFNDLEADKHYVFEMTMKGLGDRIVDEATGKEMYKDFGLFWSMYQINDGNESQPYTLLAHQAAHMEAGILSFYAEGTLVFYSSISTDVTFKYYEDTLFGTEFEETEAVYDEETKTLSWNPIENAVNYVVAINGQKIVVEGNENTQLVMEEYFDGSAFEVYDVAVYPSIGFNDYYDGSLHCNIIVAPEEQTGLAAHGGTVSLEEKSVTLRGTYAQNKTYNSARAMDNSFFAFRGEYGVGYYVEFGFTGNNLPQVSLFSNDLTGNMTNSKGGKGILLLNGWASADGTPIKTSNTSYDTLCDRFLVLGTERIAEGLDYGNSRIITASSQKGDDGLPVNVPAIAASALKENTEYRYVVGTYLSGKYITFDIKLYEKTATGETLVFDYEDKGTGVLATDVEAGNIVCYAGVKGKGLDTSFTYKEPQKTNRSFGETETETIKVYKGYTETTSKTVTLQSGGIANQQKTAFAALDNGYIAFKGAYSYNTRVDFYFTGKNMPIVKLFASAINGDMTDGGGSGYLFANGFYQADGTTSTHSNWNTRYVVFGPNGMWDTKLDNGKSRVVDCKSSSGSYTAATLANLDENTNYKYSVFTYENDATGALIFKIQLWTVAENGTETRVYAYEGVAGQDSLKVNAADVTAGNIICYAPVKGTGTATFTYVEPYACTDGGEPITA